MFAAAETSPRSPGTALRSLRFPESCPASPSTTTEDGCRPCFPASVVVTSPKTRSAPSYRIPVSSPRSARGLASHGKADQVLLVLSPEKGTEWAHAFQTLFIPQESFQGTSIFVEGSGRAEETRPVSDTPGSKGRFHTAFRHDQSLPAGEDKEGRRDVLVIPASTDKAILVICKT